ncbi:hypothetical protein GCM10028807_54290 [Spirosoma daeguense]
MSDHGSRYLIEQLLNNKLSRAELDEFLAGLHHETSVQTYSDALETHFNELLNEHGPLLETDEPSLMYNEKCTMKNDE